MSVIGITGGISTGKTAFADCLRALLPKARFFDADEVARELTYSNEKVLGEIRAHFGPSVFQQNGELNRAALRAIIFNAPEKRGDLEQILHPRIRQRWSGEAERYRNSIEFFFADIPLLYETGGEALCDRVTVIGAQMLLPEKAKRADHVVWNNGTRSELAEQARLLVSLWTKQ